MGIEGILNKIDAGTDIRIGEIEEDTNRTIAEIEAEVADFEASAMKKAERRAEFGAKRTYEQTINRAEAELRKELLGVKQKLVKKAFDNGYRAILEMPVDEIRASYVNMLSAFDEKSGDILFGKADSGIFDDHFDALVAERIPGADFNKKLSGDFERGFILVAGKIQYDARLPSVFAEMIEQLTDDISEICFSNLSEAEE